MQQWDRDTLGRLNRISTQLDPTSEVSVPTDTMDPLPEEQQSQPATPMNPNAYRTMRDHIHPPRVSAPSCIIPPADDVAVRPYLVPYFPHIMVWKMKIHTHILGILRRFALPSRKA